MARTKFNPARTIVLCPEGLATIKFPEHEALLPALEGSEGQVRWATTIRGKFIRAACDYRGDWDEATNLPPGFRATPEVAAALSTLTSARFWIDFKDQLTEATVLAGAEATRRGERPTTPEAEAARATYIAQARREREEYEAAERAREQEARERGAALQAARRAEAEAEPIPTHLVERGYTRQNSHVCDRCGGSGRYSFNLKDLDKCYGCNGVGRVRVATKAGRK